MWPPRLGGLAVLALSSVVTTAHAEPQQSPASIPTPAPGPGPTSGLRSADARESAAMLRAGLGLAAIASAKGWELDGDSGDDQQIVLNTGSAAGEQGDSAGDREGVWGRCGGGAAAMALSHATVPRAGRDVTR